MRRIGDTIDRIIAVIPPHHTDMVAALNKIKEDCGYTAPEMMRRQWLKLSLYLNSQLPWPPTPQWHTLVYNIVTGKDGVE